MLFINDLQSHIVSAKKKHCQLIICYVKRKIYGSSTKFSCKNTLCEVCKNDIRQVKKLSDRFLEAFKSIDIDKVISGKPDELYQQSQKFKTKYFSGLKRTKFTIKEKKILESIFNYSWFIKKDNTIYNAYNLCEELKIESCVYCNRLYTSTVINEKGKRIIRPTLDHWYPQKNYPILALSFYNLIPSCSPCNSSVKHEAVFDLANYVHPYVQKDFTKQYKLDYLYDTSLKKYQISVSTSDIKIKKTLEDMYIADIYTHHQSEIEDLDLLKRKYNEKYIKDIGTILGKTLTEKDVYRILFGVEYDDENFYKRPLSKLKKDILDLKLK